MLSLRVSSDINIDVTIFSRGYGVYKIVVDILKGWGGYLSGQKREISGRRGGGLHEIYISGQGSAYFTSSKRLYQLIEVHYKKESKTFFNVQKRQLSSLMGSLRKQPSLFARRLFSQAS